MSHRAAWPLGAAWFACLVLLDASATAAGEGAAGTRVAARPGDGVESVDTRSGLYGLGLGLEVPMVGIIAGVGEKSRPGAGYNLGVSLTWESTPWLLLRISCAGGRAFGGRASLTYEEGGRHFTVAQDVDWLNYQAGAGIAYLWRGSALGIVPYIGLDGAIVYSGYRFLLDGTYSDRLADPTAPGLRTPACEVEHRCSDDIYEALSYGFSAEARLGVRLPILVWLSTQAELAASYTPLASQSLENTLTSLKARSLRDALWLVRATFSVRLAI